MADTIKGKVEKAGHAVAEAAKKAGNRVSEGAEKATDWAKKKLHQAGTMIDTDRTVLMQYLLRCGPTPGDELVAAVGLTLEEFWPLINHAWFEITGKGWRVSDTGRRDSGTAAPTDVGAAMPTGELRWNR